MPVFWTFRIVKRATCAAGLWLICFRTNQNQNFCQLRVSTYFSFAAVNLFAEVFGTISYPLSSFFATFFCSHFVGRTRRSTKKFVLCSYSAEKKQHGGQCSSSQQWRGWSRGRFPEICVRPAGFLRSTSNLQERIFSVRFSGCIAQDLAMIIHFCLTDCRGKRNSSNWRTFCTMALWNFSVWIWYACCCCCFCHATTFLNKGMSLITIHRIKAGLIWQKCTAKSSTRETFPSPLTRLVCLFRPIDWLIDWLVCLFRSIDWLIDWLVCLVSINWLIDWSIDWLIRPLTCQCSSAPVTIPFFCCRKSGQFIPINFSQAGKWAAEFLESRPELVEKTKSGDQNGTFGAAFCHRKNPFGRWGVLWSIINHKKAAFYVQISLWNRIKKSVSLTPFNCWQSINQSINWSLQLSSNQSINQSIDRSLQLSSNQSINQSSNQSINASA